MSIKIQSRKSKARRLQQAVVKSILDRFEELLVEGDVRSCSMGAQGSDVILSPLAKKALKCEFECKAQEAFSSLSKAYDQAVANAKGSIPVCVVKTNRHKPMAVIDLDTFIGMLHILYYYQNEWDKLV